ncbi:hypothetical protein G9C98_006060 [Cotesia typhae]|uniref:WW domain binding protein VOPP1 n=1 Tax=Cotesia typhae TaxID=2053667 RepID=A0A8J5V8E1_9HYME|nr:hypothetical protein G9C98_006060 [Cotesia typhae]
MFVLPLKVSAKFCNGGHDCSPPKECCSLGCCYMYSQPTTPVTEMFAFLIWTYWYLCSISDRASSSSFYLPPHYSRCSSFVQALPPPYNEVTAKPDLYPLVIGFDEGMGKGTSGFVMRYFRTLSHASTLDSLSSSFMCNVVNEANTIIPPPYSCDNSIDELSTMGCDRAEIGAGESVVSLTNNRTTSDISSLAAQSPCSPPRATSPTLELRELLDKIQQLPNEHNSNVINHQNRAQALHSSNINSSLQRPPSPSGECASSRMRRARGKMYMPLGLPNSRNKTKRWLSRSAPTTPSGNIPMALFPGQNMRPLEHDNYNQQVIPLLSEQEETDNININSIENSHNVTSLLREREEQL